MTNNQSPSHTKIKPVAIFRWEAQLPSDDEIDTDPKTRHSPDYGEQWAYQSARPIASQILESFRSHGLQADMQTPDFDETGWFFTIDHEGERFSFFISWVGIEKSDNSDRFSVQVSREVGFIGSVLFRRTKEPTASILRVVAKALDSSPRISHLQWLTNKEYAVWLMEQ